MIFFYFKLFFRHFKRYKIYNTINLFGLSLGLAAVILIGSWIQFHLSFDTFFPDHQQLFRVIQQIREGGRSEWVAPTPTPLAVAIKNSVPGIDNTCRIHYGADLIVKANGKILSEKKVIYADTSFISLFNLNLIYFDAVALKNPHFVMLSESNAKKYFGAVNPAGKTMTVANQQDVMVAGIYHDLPPNSHFDFEMILPLSLAVELGYEIFMDTWHDFDEIYTYVKINEFANPEKINHEISDIKSNYVSGNQDVIMLQPVTSIHTRTDLKYDLANTLAMNKIFIFSSIAGLLLLIAVFNYVIFTIALSSSRFKETSIRKINGASSKDLILGHLLPGLLVTSISIALGLILIEISAPFMQEFLHYPVQNIYSQVSLWSFLGALLLLITFPVGFYPGIRLIHINPLSFIKTMERTDFSRNRLLNYLVIFQFAVSLCLLIFAVSIRDQLKFIRDAEIGFGKDQLISIRLYDQSKEILRQHMDAFLKEMKDLPVVEEVTYACSSPAVVNTSADDVDWEGREEGEMVQVQWNAVFYNYFPTIGVEILSGTNFSEDYTDQLASEESAVFILNEAAVKEMNLTPEKVLNRDFELYGRKGPVIGVVKDFHFKSFHETIQPMAFFIHPYYFNNILLRYHPDIPEALSIIENVYHQYFTDIPFEYTFVKDEYDSIYQSEEDLYVYNTGLALLIVLIAAMGLSSLAMLLVHNKSKEIGIRKINGATGRDIFKLYMTYFGKWILMAMFIGIPFSIWIISRWLEHFAYRISLKIQFFLYPVLFLVLVSFLSVMIQVIKASRANPVETLRYE